MINTIRLEPTEPGTGSVNTRVIINDHDIGILYLNKDEFDILHDVLKIGSGVAGSNVQIDVADSEEEIDYDMFDDI